ncbi:MAG: hypothetical protein ACYC5O_18355, partial [Anaerolineae bacterium]
MGQRKLVPRLLRWLASSIVVAALALPGLPQAAPVAEAADSSVLYLRVVSARTEPLANDGAGVTEGQQVTSYEWMISVDNTGDPTQPTFPDCYPYLDPPTNSIPNEEYPSKCDWPSIRTVPGWAPVYTQGNETDLSETVGVNLPAGRYLISVLADGYKLDGEHFTAPFTGVAPVVVRVQPLPLPPATMLVKVFNDMAMTNGMYDAPVEPGLAGFRASVADTMGEVTQDVFGHPLCTIYQKDPVTGAVLTDPVTGAPLVQTLGSGCYSDANGDILIPNIVPLRYDVLVTAPDGTDWVQTSTLEGSQGWDTWLMEGGTGLDNEFIVAAEPFPWTIFAFVQPNTPVLTGTGSISGVVMSAQVYTPFVGGLPYQGTVWGGLGGAKIDHPIADLWVSLNDLQQGDTAIWVGQGNPDGSFTIPNVPAGNYSLTYWDEKQHHILDWVQVTVNDGQVTDLGTLFLTGWFTEWYGHVFYDYNENGKMDPGEPGVKDYTVVQKDRDNTETDRMSILSVTDVSGYYILEKGYPMGSWMVLEAYNPLFRSTGITFQASNQPEETTILGDGVDVNVLPIIGQKGRLDWGVLPYSADTNGGIVGTVTYDTMRTETDASRNADLGAMPFEPGIPDVQLNLYATVRDAFGNFVMEADGSYKKGALLNTAVTETYARPQNCQARDVNGSPVDFPVLPPASGGYDCLEGPLMGVQFGTEFAALDGNYALTEILTMPDGTPLEEPMA